jgi:hypothetical protein
MQSDARNGRFIEPDQRDLGRPVRLRKIFRFSCRANHLYKLAPSRLTEGRFAIVTDVERGMRWTRMAPLTNGADADGESCGPDAPTLVSSFADKNPQGDGGKKARSPGRVRSKSLKPLRGECRAKPV